ncbi:hypothetical protein Salat_1458900 [Sesamum alatum]|uniref:CCHC-type domain-containing protein n=1 Tax=Sesamum alatum TaxID=300844 RepID=A0AAE1YBR7_9LAMI|nr:hypothetical protein Salat_1458900 [Sesamum alatum]
MEVIEGGHAESFRKLKEPGEASNPVRKAEVVRCKVCNQQGHNRRTCPVSQNNGKNLEMDVPLTQLARNMKKRKRGVASTSQQEVQALKSKKTEAARPLISNSQPIGSSSQQIARPLISSSQPLPRTEQGPNMQAAGSSSQPHSYIDTSYLPLSFWRGIGVSPLGDTRSKKTKAAEETNPSADCKQQ